MKTKILVIIVFQLLAMQYLKAQTAQQIQQRKIADSLFKIKQQRVLDSIHKVKSQTDAVKRRRKIDSLWHNHIDITKPLFMNDNNISGDTGKDVAFSIILTPYSPMMLTGDYNFYEKKDNKKNDRTGAYILGLAVKDMFAVLYGKPMRKAVNGADLPLMKIPYSRIEFRGVDTTKLVDFLNGKFVIENGWSMQVTSTIDLDLIKVRKQMILALEQQFGLKTFFEKQRKTCLVFSKNELTIPEYRYGEADSRIGNSKNGYGYISVNKIDWDFFFHWLQSNFFHSGVPFIDETGFKGLMGIIDFKTKEPKLTFANLTSNLAPFGIKVTMEERLIDVLVIAKADQNP